MLDSKHNIFKLRLTKLNYAQSISESKRKIKREKI